MTMATTTMAKMTTTVPGVTGREKGRDYPYNGKREKESGKKGREKENQSGVTEKRERMNENVT